MDLIKANPGPCCLAACLVLWMLTLSMPEAGAEKKKKKEVPEESEEAPTAGMPDDPVIKEAITHFQKGVGFFNEESYGAALVEFLKSYELHPNWALRYNIGICYVETGKVVEGLEEFRLYLEEGGDEIDPDRRKEVENLIGEIEGKIGFVEIRPSEQGASNILDEYKEVGDEISGPIALMAGLHTLVVKKSGFETVSREFKLASGETKVIEVALKALTSPALQNEKKKEPEPVKKEPEKLVKPKRWLWAGLGTGLALGAGAVVTGSLTLVKRNDMRDAADACDATAARSDCPEAYDLQEQARGLMIATNVLWGVAGAAAALGLVLFLLDKPRPVEEKSPQEGGDGKKKKTARVMIGPALYGTSEASPGLQAWIGF